MYAVIEIPGLALQALYRERSAPPPARPQAVLDESGERSFVCEINPAAAREGVAIGMRPAQALARCETLEMLLRSPAAEAPVERLLLLLAQSFAPRVEQTRQGLVTIDLRGLAPATLEATAEDLVERFKALKLAVRMGLSDTPEHARWSALFANPVLAVRSLKAFLQRVPLEVSEADPGLLDILHGWGIRNMLQLQALPREEVGLRLGQRGLDLWDTIAGRSPRLLKIAPIKPHFTRSLSLEHQVNSLEALLFILKRFVDELALELEAANTAAYILNLSFKLDDNTLKEKQIEVPQPSSRASTLFRILETALERLETKEAITGVRLSLGVTEARRRQGDLFAVEMQDVASFTETADRIATIVGPGRSGSPRHCDTWRPDTFRMENLDTTLGHSDRMTEPPAEEKDPNIGLPLARCRPPQKIKLILKDGMPAQILNGAYAGQICAARGPWKASGDWWEQTRWSREEWDIEHAEGGLYRIYREKGQWFIEGVYG